MSYIWFYKNNNEKVPLNEKINKEVNDSYQSHRKNEIHSINFFTDDEPNIVYHVDFTKNTITISSATSITIICMTNAIFIKITNISIYSTTIISRNITHSITIICIRITIRDIIRI